MKTHCHILCNLLSLRIVLFSLIAGCTIVAGASEREIYDTVSVRFKQSHIEIDTLFDDNGKRLMRVLNCIKTNVDERSPLHFVSVDVVGAASPEGSVSFNRWLSEQRANNLVDYVDGRISLPDSLTHYRYTGRDWQGLRDLVEGDLNVPYRGDVIELLDDICADIATESNNGDNNLARLKLLRRGEPYRYMYQHLFPTLRRSTVVVKYEPVLADTTSVLRPGDYCIVPPVNAPAFQLLQPTMSWPSEVKPFYMGLRTNMLYDALAIPNIGIEFYLGKNWSIGGNWMYAWWDNDSRHRYWRIYGGDMVIRRWFGSRADDKPLTGHHIGLYAGAVTYDFEFGGKGIMGGIPRGTLWDRCQVTAGIEYGYSLPVGRRWNIDFTIGIGYLGGKYVKYVPDGKCYDWQSTNRLNYFGPTKIEVSLVWLLGRGNYNEKRGGRL